MDSDIYVPLHPDTLSNPFPVFRRLQEVVPVVWHDDLFAWVISGYDDCRRVLGSPRKFPRDPAKLLGVKGLPLEEMTIQSHDPPDTLPLRQALAKALNQIDISAVCQEANDKLKHCIAGQPERAQFDFMTQVAAPTALSFACRLIGVPESATSTDHYESIFIRITRAMDSSLDENRHGPGVDATRELNELITAAQSANQVGSVIFELKQNSMVSEMSAGYVRNTVAAMFNAAYSTAHTSMGSILALAFEHPGVANSILNSGDVGRGVQELLRFTSPAQSTLRYCAQDSDFNGVTIRKNDRIVTLMAAANRDPAQFERPSELLIDRSPNHHLGFGWGPHFCIGAAPAQAFLEDFVRQLASLQEQLIPEGELKWLDTATLRCLDCFPVSRRERDVV